MIYSGVKPGGEEILLPAPAQVRFDSAEDAPADSFRGVFPLSRSCGTLTGLKIRSENGGELFCGTVDVQREISSGSGNLLQLSCRNLAGLLLDSEAIPQTYGFPSLPAIFERHIKPYGFSGFQGNSNIFAGPLRIVKGMSEWQAAAAFCKKYFSVTPRVRGSVFDASGEAAQDEILFDNARGIRYFHAEVKNRCCDRFSEIFAPSGDTGAYLSAARDDETASLGIVRNRCLTKASSDAAAILKAADRKAYAVIVECPGSPQAEVGTPASLNDPLLGACRALTVSEICCISNAGGTQTRYVLRKQ